MTNTIHRRADLILAPLRAFWCALPCAVCLALWTGPLAALDLPLPEGAEVTFETQETGARYALPIAPWSAETGVPVAVIEGGVRKRAWRIAGGNRTPTQLLSPLRNALDAAGYTFALDCAARRCGGFDFRFATEVIPAPDMYLDLADYRFLSAMGASGDGVAIFTSRNKAAGFVQVIHAIPTKETGAPPVPGTLETRPIEATDSIIATLERRGAVVLQGVDFASGSASLSDGPIPELDALARYLRATPDRRILFVGHTDAVGSLAANRALSQRRAEAAAAYLRAAGIDRDQIAAEGAGYLAPIAPNLTEKGRRENRRVEAVLLRRE